MRIAMIGQKGIPARYGGVERHVHDLAVGLVEYSHSVTVYGRKWYTQKTPSTVSGVRICYLPSLRTKHLDTASHTFLATLHALFQPYDIVHYHGVGPSLFAWIPRLLTPHKTVIITFHSVDRKNEKWGALARLCLKLGEWTACHFGDKVIAVSTALEQYIRDVYDINATYIPNSVPLYKKTKDTKPLSLWGLQPGGYIMMLARLIPLKGAHHLIEAYERLQKKNPGVLAGKKLVIVGDGSHTDRYVKNLKLKTMTNPQIVFTGVQSGKNLAALLSHAALMVHPSVYEGLPFAVLEGMSYGVPLIVSDIPEHRSLVTSPLFRFMPKQNNALATCIKRVLTMSPLSLKKEIEKNRMTIKQQFTSDKTIKQIITLYQDSLAKKEVTDRYERPYAKNKKLALS